MGPLEIEIERSSAKPVWGGKAAHCVSMLAWCETFPEPSVHCHPPSSREPSTHWGSASVFRLGLDPQARSPTHIRPPAPTVFYVTAHNSVFKSSGLPPSPTLNPSWAFTGSSVCLYSTPCKLLFLDLNTLGTLLLEASEWLSNFCAGDLQFGASPPPTHLSQNSHKGALPFIIGPAFCSFPILVSPPHPTPTFTTYWLKSTQVIFQSPNGLWSAVWKTLAEILMKGHRWCP